MEIDRGVPLTELPNELLLTICNFLPSSGLYKCLQVSRALKGISQYILEHKRKVRFVDDNLRVIFVGLDESGKTSVINRLLGTEPVRFSTPNEKVKTYRRNWKQKTTSMRDRTQIITLIDPPASRLERAQVWREAFGADLCVLVIGAYAKKPVNADEIEQLMLGTCHMMSCREVIVAINLGDTQPDTEKVYQQYKQEVVRILKKTIGPLFDVIPISVSTNTNIAEKTYPYSWYKGFNLAQAIVRSQQQTNWNEVEVDKLRHNKEFEMQFYHKYYIRGVGCVVSGLVTSGRLEHDKISPLQVQITPTDQLITVRAIEMQHQRVNVAEAGDIVGLSLMQTTVRDVRKKWGFAFAPTTQPIDITRAFRVKLFVVQPNRMALKGFYRVYYGGSRIPCVLWWVLPDEKIKKDGLRTVRAMTAIMVPLVILPMKVYKATVFQKNYHGKVMLAQRNTVVAIGRIDKVLNQELPINDLHVRQNRQQERLDYILKKGADLFKEDEAAIRQEFLDYAQTQDAKDVILTYHRNTEDHNHIKIKFLIDVDKHCNVRVVGNIDALGKWAPASGLRTRWLIDTLFESEITINKNSQNIIEYKYVSCPDNPADLKWEDGPNRILDISSCNFLQVQDNFQIEDNAHKKTKTDAKLVNFDKTFGRTIEPKKTTKNWLSNQVLVRFHVAAGTKFPLDSIIICGNSAPLNRVTMQYTYPMWELDVLVPIEDFPIQYKYATHYWKPEVPTQAVVEETRQPRTIQLPTNTTYERVMIQVHDEYRSQSPVMCFTTPVMHAHLQNWIKLRSSAVLDPLDNKAIVSNNYDTYSAVRFHKPFKIRNPSPETLTLSNINEETWQLLYDALTEDVCPLRRIEFRDSSTAVTIDEIEQFADMLQHNDSFTELTVFGRALTVDRMCEAIGSHRRLKKLHVLVALTPQLCELIGLILARTNSIYHLGVSFDHMPTFFVLYDHLVKSTRLSSLTLDFTQFIAAVTSEEATRFYETLKHDDTLRSISISIEDTNSLLCKIFDFNDEFFQVNWSLTNADLKSQARTYLDRNKQYQQDMLDKMIVLLYNFARSREVLEFYLPIELWLLIFSFVKYPGRKHRFDVIFTQLLDDAECIRPIVY